ncbi:unnamed protein product, partial [Rhizoctonia solani]
MVMNFQRTAREPRTPFNLKIDDAPVSSFDDMSVLIALKTLLPQEVARVTRKFYVARFGNISFPGDVFSYLDPVHTPQDLLNLNKVKAIAQSEEFKVAFNNEHTNLVNNHCAFGLPWIIVQKPGEEHLECFWGSELSSIVHWLGPGYEHS